MFTTLRKVIVLGSPGNSSSIRLQSLLNEQDVHIREIKDVDMVPIGFSVIDLECFSALDSPSSKLGYLPADLLSWPSSETINTARANDCNLFAGFENNFIDISVPSVIGERSNFRDASYVAVNFGSKMGTEAVLFPVKNDRGARGVNQIGRVGKCGSDCTSRSNMIIIGSVYKVEEC
jgi:hypothetical protein